MAYTRLFKYWSGISHYSSTTCKCSCACGLPTFTLHLPVSTLNDSLFPNSSWFMMSNPKIPSKTLFVLSHSRATSFPRCLPSFTLTGTACLPPWRQMGLTGADEHAAHWIAMSRSDALEEQQKGEGAVTTCGRPSHLLPLSTFLHLC